MTVTIEEELLLRYFMPADRKDEDAHFLTTTDILIKLEVYSKKVIIRNVCMALKKLGFERVAHSQKGVKVKGYFVIQLFNLR